jgi:hypothetical protein
VDNLEAVIRNFARLLKTHPGDTTVTLIYHSLSGLSSKFDEASLKLDTEIIVNDLAEPNTTKAVASYLLRVHPSRKEYPAYVDALLVGARTHETCLLILLGMAGSKGVAQTLAEDHSWLSRDLPTVWDTLRLFLVVLKYVDGREWFTADEADEEVVGFLNRLLTQEGAVKLSLISHVVKRLPLTREFVAQLSEQEFIRNYFTTVRGLPEDDRTNTLKGIRGLAFAFLSQVARKVDDRDAPLLADYTVEFINGIEPGRVRDAAIATAKVLAKNPKAATRLKRANLPEIFAEASVRRSRSPPRKH